MKRKNMLLGAATAAAMAITALATIAGPAIAKVQVEQSASR